MDARIALIRRLLELPDWELRTTACGMAQDLVTTWRSNDFGPLVLAVAQQIIRSHACWQKPPSTRW